MSRLLGNLLRNAQNIKPKVEEKISELSRRRVEGVSGTVRVVASGDKQIVSIEVGGEDKDQPVDGKIKEDIMKASNIALEKANKIVKEEANKLLGDMGLFFPGLF